MDGLVSWWVYLFLYKRLQYQTTHHLFPRLPRHLLRSVREEYTMKFAVDNNKEYLHFGFLESNLKLLTNLKEVSDCWGNKDKKYIKG